MVFLLEKNPFNLFLQWYKAALDSSCKKPTAMTLATCSKDCIPSARMVLLKECSEEGFVFFTNVNSKKGKELIENPRAALIFHWAELSRQVRIEGNVKLLDSKKTDEYFYSRSRDSQFSALCSKQSKVLKNWQDFEQAIELKKKEFYGTQVPRPDFWVGFQIIPLIIEFWQEGRHRRHIRFKYTFVKDERWRVEQLYP
ncbi:MAG: pyridoxamine 5'-phosphate oxidase [Wolbachia endosymbiont of Meromenopon meropis]|nr:pyridoxamine 5'-phosphate oxidase [Wolbachia endosymbiont of Meromenopon meropis]